VVTRHEIHGGDARLPGNNWSFQPLRRPVAGRSPMAAGHPGKSGRAATPQPPGTAPVRGGHGSSTAIGTGPSGTMSGRLDGTGGRPACRE
jgi:hypothetical protein